MSNDLISRKAVIDYLKEQNNNLLMEKQKMELYLQKHVEEWKVPLSHLEVLFWLSRWPSTKKR